MWLPTEYSTGLFILTSYSVSPSLPVSPSTQDDRDNSFTKPYSEATANTIDEEVRKMVAAAYARTVEVCALCFPGCLERQISTFNCCQPR